MRASDSRTACVDVHVVRDDQIGGAGDYVGRPGFWHGGGGVAACWHGIARRIGNDLAEHAARRDDPFFGRRADGPRRRWPRASALLAAAARQIDEHPADVVAARRRAELVRVAVEQSCRLVLEPPSWPKARRR